MERRKNQKKNYRIWIVSSLEARKAASSGGNNLQRARASSKFPEAANWTTCDLVEKLLVRLNCMQWVHHPWQKVTLNTENLLVHIDMRHTYLYPNRNWQESMYWVVRCSNYAGISSKQHLRVTKWKGLDQRKWCSQRPYLYMIFISDASTNNGTTSRKSEKTFYCTFTRHWK